MLDLSRRWFSFVSLVAIVSFATLMAGCAADDTADPEVPGPALGKADSGDAADRTCRVILREVKSLDEGYVDVDTVVLAGGATPAVLFSTNGQTFVERSNLTKVAGAPSGFQRFRFALGISNPPDQVQLIPFVHLSGGRLFDHNRIASDLDNYVLDKSGAYTVALDEDTCPAKGSCDVPGVALQRSFPGIDVAYPTAIRQAPGDRTRLFVVQKGGSIKAFANQPDVAATTTFLDIESRTYRTDTGELGWEEGMFDLAFDPTFPTVPEAYVTYVNGVGKDMQWRLSRFLSKDGGKTLDPTSEQILIQLQKPEDTHNGGSLAFGPDGFLYVSVGDGGGVLDPHDNAQNPNVLFGKILRLDIAPAARGTQGYGVPASNPFVGNGKGRPEIYALGIRNPWRMSFDRKTGDLWEAEVGQDAREEVNLIVSGGNYGYPNREAKRCTGKGSCNGNFIDPVIEIFHTNQNAPAGAPVGNSVIGGYVYRGAAIPDLKGMYVYADFITGVIWGFRKGSPAPIELTETGQSIAAFGEDVDGELYFVHHQAVGRIFKLVAGACKVPRPRDGRFYAFLSRDGVASKDDALSYYQSNLPGVDLATYTRTQWETDHMGGAKVTAFYRNTMDLGFWRDMACTKTLGRGVGGCRVTNYANEGDRSDPTKNLGTVTMDISPEGFTRFYVFGPDGVLTPVAVLDSEGQKSPPTLCTVCHGGRWTGPGADPDVGAIFREFEPSLLQRRTGISATTAEKEWYALNKAILSANKALRSEAEGSPSDFNKWRDSIVEYVDKEIYSKKSPPVSRDVSDPFHITPSWKTGADPALVAAKATLFTTVVRRYCLGCHATNTKDFREYSNFESLAAQQGGQSLLKAYTTGDPTHLDNRALAFMPQAKLMFENLAADTKAQQAIDAWLALVSSPAGPQCHITFKSNGPNWTHAGQDVWITGNTAALGNWNPTGGLKLSGAAFPIWQGTIDLPQGAPIEYKATVVDSATGAITWEGGVNRQIDIPTGTTCAKTFASDWRNP